jgi:hypothetical protein
MSQGKITGKKEIEIRKRRVRKIPEGTVTEIIINSIKRKNT